MTRDAHEDTRTYKVVVNGEEQYSVWPAGRSNPRGWMDEGTCGSRAECLAHVRRVWIDMRPRSLRIRMKERGQIG